MICLHCNNKSVEKIGMRRYYCSNCCHAFEEKVGEMILYILDKDEKYQKVYTIAKVKNL
ncbi:hypothetical protein AN619_29160 [Thermotalea metallivorans]|uniref:InsA N-terminal domain-containing protein n=1 Tax=Thermotalea metallivorans TaxID=520762 RepID=A0A140KZM6_9FIRM|nr:hypothetical protein AN619_29160 [Thermotalea metallivorans]